jgi:signal transduction histidine kinase
MSAPVTILLVDDEARNLDALEVILDDPGYHLLRAQDADTALRLLLGHPVAAIVLDIKMPGVSGFELAQLIKGTKKFRQVPIVFLTAHMIDDDNKLEGYGAGAVDYLTKPVNPIVLRQKISVFAELFRKTRALSELNDTLEERVRERTAELERSEAALQLVARQKDEFLAVLAHELRNPLAPLRTGLDLVMRVRPVLPGIDRTLAAMNRQVDHMVRLIDDLLDVSRINTGKLELKKQPVDLALLVERSLDAVRVFFDRRKQTVEIESGPPVTVLADDVRIVQILGNVLHNASKFTPDGGTIRVSVRNEGGQAMVNILDTGAGIPTAQIGRIFDMFAHIERPMSAGDRGLGIGLALARKLASMHGGTLTAESAGLGCGSTFTLSLPVFDEIGDRKNDAGRAAATAPTSALSIVLVEDSDDNLETLVAWLRAAGHSVRGAPDGETGVRLISDEVPDLVLCDLGLPGMDGLDVCRAVRSLALSQQPIMIALTGWGRSEDRQRTSEAGFDDHLVKPIDPRALAALLDVYGLKLGRQAT